MRRKSAKRPVEPALRELVQIEVVEPPGGVVAEGDSLGGGITEREAAALRTPHFSSGRRLTALSDEPPVAPGVKN
jgi:hypothetical protein